MTDHAMICEVGPRDGLQMTRTFVPTERKLAWCRAEVAAGIADIEVTSFVPPHVIPQFADAKAVAEGLKAIPGIRAGVLVPNLKGATLALDAGVERINYVLSASEEHNRSNVRRSTAESLEDFRRIIAERDARGLKGKVRIGSGIATSFGCTIQGRVPEERAPEIAAALVDAGAAEIMVADTVGYAGPAQVRRIMAAVLRVVGDVPVSAHFHDTRGLGLANVTAAVEVGIRRFDASLAGLGGCPFAPGATGNINTEDCAFLLERLGLETGIDIDALVRLREEVETWLPGERFSGAVARAGLPKTYRQAA